MIDLYKRLGLEESADENAIRAALAKASRPDRASAEAILLDRRRRAVYDRNRQLLLSISQLRGHLGLNYTRFWARREFKDFWHDLTPLQPRPAGRRVDALMIARAIHVVGVHGRRHSARWGPWAWVAGVCALIAALAVLIARSPHSPF